ncbi:hypothetical protein [Sediminibacillus massiliensis]|uniref:hypothetical protein n=1 Tax=Sediminibacillus massiliensis TaxID=1926277 RepID=UPI0009888B85|nr:hypothetical protein [Sediminibacillus massiliensis]
MDDLGYLLIKGLGMLSRNGSSKCKACHSKFPVQEMISVNDMKEDIDFKYVNTNWVIYHLILKDQADRDGDTNIVHLCSDCYKARLSKANRKYLDAYSSMNQVKTFPANYNGNFKLDDKVDPKIETYNFSGGKWNTLNKMKFWAAWEGFNLIYNITYDYQYDQKTVTGIFAKLKDAR